MNILHTIFLGIVEGLTEFLPISSTAHLEIASSLMQIPVTDFLKSFEIVIQFGAILAVVFLYWQKFFKSWKYLRNIVIAFLPTGVIGFVLYKLIKHFFLGNLMIVAWALVLGGIVILFLERKQKRDPVLAPKNEIEKLSTWELLILGTAQALAVVPGVSRSGAVIVSGRMLKISAPAIAEFSFLLAVPTMLAASVYDIYKSGIGFTSNQWDTIAIGFLVSFLVALFVVRWFIGYVKTHSFSIFGWYRILLGGMILAVLFF